MGWRVTKKFLCKATSELACRSLRITSKTVVFRIALACTYRKGKDKLLECNIY